uniref:Uncharacterized protein n=1 Tax=Lotus japonicus TaxID=34305 RepID=I3SXM0_LOTJA|nr:unknown [Lotus japonicus]
MLWSFAKSKYRAFCKQFRPINLFIHSAKKHKRRFNVEKTQMSALFAGGLLVVLSRHLKREGRCREKGVGEVEKR